MESHNPELDGDFMQGGSPKGTHHLGLPDRQYESMKGYALSGKIMLGAIVVLFAVVVFMICLHIYARWYILRARRRALLRRRSRRRSRNQLVFYVDPNNPTAVRGLDATVLASLPVFVYSGESRPDPLECAVCLSEFEENEKGRYLPKCKHSFHTECIDMWFQSHATCPLCRSPVEKASEDHSGEVVISVNEPVVTQSGPVPSAEVCGPSSSSAYDRRKTEVTVEVPSRGEFQAEWGPRSPASQGLRSPVARLLSLTRVLSINRKSAAASSSSTGGTSCESSRSEFDVECGGSALTQQQDRVQTPR
ncbi:hypothetical protein NMG60_11025069 [Bertholletia excelsa]